VGAGVKLALNGKGETRQIDPLGLFIVAPLYFSSRQFFTRKRSA
jgi:hypothetical protein